MRAQRRTYWAALAFTLVGLADALYLTWIKLAHQEALCLGVGDCYTVNTSRYSEFLGQPVALWGALLYLALLAALVVERRRPAWAELARYAFFGLALFGVLFSAYLTYVEVAILHAICPFCVISAVVLLFLLVLAIIRLLNPPEMEVD